MVSESLKPDGGQLPQQLQSREGSRCIRFETPESTLAAVDNVEQHRRGRFRKSLSYRMRKGPETVLLVFMSIARSEKPESIGGVDSDTHSRNYDSC